MTPHNPDKTLNERLVDHMLSTAVGRRDGLLPEIETRIRSMTPSEKIQMETEMRMRERERQSMEAAYDPCAVK